MIVHSHDQSVEPLCDWLILFEYQRRLIATIRGSDSRTVVTAAVDADYDPDSVKHYTAEEIAERFEFVERNDNIDTYREIKTGELVYHARRTETPDEVYKKSLDTVWKLRREPGEPPKTNAEASQIRDTISSLQSLAAENPDVAKVSLALGMAWFAIGEDDKAQRQLTRAADMEPENTIMLKELAGVCLTKNDLPTALDAAIKAVAIKPDDIELLGNLSVIQLISGDVQASKKTIEHANRLQPKDSVNKDVQRIVSAVISKKRERPQTLKEMMEPQKMEPQKPKSWFARIFGP